MPTDRKSDSDDLASWFRVEYPSLVRFAVGVCGDHNLAEDLVQDAYVRASSSKVDELNPGAYVRRIIVNLSRSRFRRLNAERRALSRRGPDEVFAPSTERDDQIWQALAQLSPRQRAVLTLRFYEDLSESDIARTLDISPGNVKKHASRGMDRLRSVLEVGGAS